MTFGYGKQFCFQKTGMLIELTDISSTLQTDQVSVFLISSSKTWLWDKQCYIICIVILYTVQVSSKTAQSLKRDVTALRATSVGTITVSCHGWCPPSARKKMSSAAGTRNHFSRRENCLWLNFQSTVSSFNVVHCRVIQLWLIQTLDRNSWKRI